MKNYTAITVDGRQRDVVNRYSTGPNDTEWHTYDLRGGAYIQRGVDGWYLQERGQFKRLVRVDV
jgi:hypothetical protein